MRSQNIRIWNEGVYNAVVAKALPKPDTSDSHGLWWSDYALARWFKRIDSFANRDKATIIVAQFSAK